MTEAAPPPHRRSAPRDRRDRAESILDLVGNTPLVEINRLRDGLSPRVRIFAKLEGFNPGGSVKDRPAVWMVRDGLRTGKLRAGKTIIDSTSGNTGHCPGAGRGGARLPGRVGDAGERQHRTQEDRSRLRCEDHLQLAAGRLGRRDPPVPQAPRGRIPSATSSRISTSIRSTRWHTTRAPDPRSGRTPTGTVTHFVAGLGTGGTVMGTGRYLKERNPKIQVVGVEPDDAWHGLEGLKHMASSIVPGIYHEEQLDRKISVVDRCRLRDRVSPGQRRRTGGRPVVRCGADGGAPGRPRDRCRGDRRDLSRFRRPLSQHEPVAGLARLARAGTRQAPPAATLALSIGSGERPHAERDDKSSATAARSSCRRLAAAGSWRCCRRR